jgi:integrase
MPRKVRDSNLETRTARSRLKVAHKPYFRLIEPGLHIGYRKLTSGPGTWLARRYVGEGRYTTENLRTADGFFVIADDYSDADGHAVLSFGQAQARAKEQRLTARGKQVGPYTVANAMRDYLGRLADKGKPTRDSEYRSNAFIVPKLGAIELARLTSKQVRDWHSDLAKLPPRLRTKPGKEQQYRKVGKDDETKRRRRASANRTLTVAKAALNHAWREGKVISNAEWHRVEPFEAVDAARIRYLTITEATRLISASGPDFRRLIHAALLTGARYGQLAQLTVSDINLDVGTVRLRSRKGDGSEKVYHAHLTDEGRQFFESTCAGHVGTDLVFTKDDGSAWSKSHQMRPIEEASARAKISPPANFHVTRHTYASHAVMNGVPLFVVAKNLGHSDTRMVEKHYGHLAPSYIADMIRAHAPKYGVKSSDKVVALTRS